MARPVRGHLSARSQQEGSEKPERDSQQEGQPDTAEHKVIADYDQDADYEGEESNNEPVAQDQREVDPDAEYAKMEIPHDGTLCQRTMPWNI